MNNVFIISFFGIVVGLTACARDPNGARLESLSGTLDLNSQCVTNCDLLQLPDLLPPDKQCAAAKGLMGKRIICLDFKDVTSAQLSDLGWNLSNGNVNCPKSWEVNTGFLQVTNFNNISSGVCSLSLPSIAKSNYSSVSLILMGSVNMDAPGGGYASVTLESQVLGNYFYKLIGGLNSAGKLKISTIITPDDLPTGKTDYNFYINENSGTNSDMTLGLRISSLAVIAN